MKRERETMKAIDLHVHSTCSDGTLSPTELVDYAMEKGLTAFALTDHDSVDGLAEAAEYAEKLKHELTTSGVVEASSLKAHEMQMQNNDCASERATANHPSRQVPEVIPGIELSSEYQGQDIHVVGLFINYRDEIFRNRLREFVDSRTNRNKKMCSLLQQYGIPVTYEELLEAYPDSVVTRAHYARFMFEKGYVKSRQEAFERFLGDHAPCYIPREKITPAQAVQLILQADGVPVLAHPILYHMSEEHLDELVKGLKEVGLMGIEAIYSTYSAADERQIRALASKYNLLISGGSDFHGANKPGLDLGMGYGKLFVPQELLWEIKKTLGRTVD